MFNKLLSNDVVITRLIGGLGNQLFQYAVGREVSMRTNKPLLLDVSGFENYELRRYELGGFQINSALTTQIQLASMGTATGKSFSLLERIKRRLVSESLPKSELQMAVLREASFTYDVRIESVQAPIYLDGYWQSERYFTAIRKQLLLDLTLNKDWGVSNEDMLDEIQSVGPNAVSLHVRRGDYVTNAQTASYHGVCSLDYYRDAISYIADRVNAPHFFIFSDSHDWVRANLQTGFPTSYVSTNSPEHGIYDMMLMRSCRHHIIANSSFSWWGAWLNPNQDKIVVAPQRWFSGASHDTSDLIPANWIRL